MKRSKRPYSERLALALRYLQKHPTASYKRLAEVSGITRQAIHTAMKLRGLVKQPAPSRKARNSAGQFQRQKKFQQTQNKKGFGQSAGEVR